MSKPDTKQSDSLDILQTAFASFDNIAIERFWRTLKYENVHPSSYTNIKEAKVGIGEYIDIYNKERLLFGIGLFNTK